MASESKHTKAAANTRIAVLCAAFFTGMLGMAYASVPLYKLFCQVTGYGGTTQRVEQMSDRILNKTMTVRFDANTSGGLPWEFKPLQSEISLKIGETVEIAYEARNFFGSPSRGRATFNVTPPAAGAYFNKIECFCFTDTELRPGETMKMPVVFYVDPAIVDAMETRNIRTITLSYTFFPSEEEKPVAAADLEKEKSGDRL